MAFTRCYSCMQILPAPGAICPRCGYDNRRDPARQPRHSLPCGMLLHRRYVVGRILGQGGFGMTYIAWDCKQKERVCVKEYFPDGFAMRDKLRSTLVYWSTVKQGEPGYSRSNFEGEAQKASRLLDLDSVVTVREAFDENNTSYIVMDFVDGISLKQYLQQTRLCLTEEECVRLFDPVIRDLAEVHRRGIIHRDISPDNLMLRPDRTLVLLDLGAAKDLSVTRSQSSCIVVKRGFNPMEQYTRLAEIGPWTDVYALCATLYYCATGRLLPEPLDRYNGREIDYSSLTPAFAAVLAQGLAMEKGSRFQNMEALGDALRHSVPSAIEFPAERTAEQPPIEQPPLEKPTAERPPVKQPPVKQPPVKQPPVKQPPEAGKTEGPKKGKDKRRSLAATLILTLAALCLTAVGAAFLFSGGRGGVKSAPRETPAAGAAFLPVAETLPTATPSPSAPAPATPAPSTPRPATPRPATPAPALGEMPRGGDDIDVEDGETLYRRGRAYYEAQNYTDAEDCFRQAIACGNGYAAYYLAIMYYNGEGVIQSSGKAILLMNKALEFGCPLDPPAWYINPS